MKCSICNQEKSAVELWGFINDGSNRCLECKEKTTVIVMGETVELTDEQFDAIQDLYVKCHSCGQYCDAVAPREREYVCEMCLE